MTRDSESTILETMPCQVFRPEPRFKIRGTTVSALIYSSGNVIELAMRLAAGLATARIIGPSILGKFAGAALILGYVPAALLGVTNGLGRDLPYNIGAGRRDFALQLTAVANAWSLGIGIVCFLGCLSVSIFYAIAGEMQLCSVWATNGISAFVLCYAQQYLYVLYRTTGDFSSLSLIRVLQGVVLLVGTIAVWAWKFEGLCVRVFLLALLNGILLWIWRPIRIRPNWDRRLFIQLLKTGLPIYAAGQLWALWMPLNGTLVFTGTGSHGLGLYAVANIAVSGIMAVNNSFTNVVYPKMTEEYGRSGNRRRALRTALRPTVVLISISLICLLCGLVFMGPAVRILLPKYADGVPAARWALGAAALLALTPPFSFFNVVKKQILYAICIACGIGAYAGIIYMHPGSRSSLEFYPKAMLIGTSVYIVTSYAFLLWLIQQPVASRAGASQ